MDPEPRPGMTRVARTLPARYDTDPDYFRREVERLFGALWFAAGRADQIPDRGGDRTEVVCEWHFHPDEVARPGFDPGDVVRFWDMTNRQVGELSQLGIGSRACKPGPYSGREGILHEFDRMVLRAMGTEPDAGADLEAQGRGRGRGRGDGAGSADRPRGER